MQPLLQWLRETIVRLHLVSKQCIAADLGGVEKIQECHSRWLSFVRNIGMPAHSTGAVCKESIDLAAGCSIAVHNVEFGVTFWASACRVDVMATKMGAKLKLLLGWDIGEILITESYNLTLSDKKGELISSCGGQLAQLNTGDLGSNAWGELLNLATFWEEIFESGVCVFAVLDIVEQLQRGVLLSVVPCR